MHRRTLLPSHSRRVVLATTILASILLGSVAPTAVAQKPEKVCYKCKNTGKLEPRSTPPPEGIVHDSYYYRNDPDGGAGFALCERTPLDEVIQEYERIRAKNQKWLEPVIAFEETTGRPCFTVETRDIKLFLGLDRVKVNRKRHRQPRAAREYALYLQRVHDRYRELFGVEEPERGAKHEVYIAFDQAGMGAYVRKHFGRSLGSSSGFTYSSPKTYRYATRRGSDSDEKLEQRVVYAIATMFLFKYHRPGEVPDWITLGFKSFLEYDFYGDNENYTFAETPPDDPYKADSDWKKRLKRDVNTENFIPLAELAGKELVSYSYRDAAFAFGYVDFLLNHDRAKFQELVRKLKTAKDPDSMQAIQEVYGWLPAEVDELYRSYALRSY